MYDVIFIGAGPGGYVGAIKASLNGLNCAIVEKGETFGGTCVSVGCIPTKVLLHSAYMYEKMKKAKNIGIEVENISLNLKAMMKQKEKVVKGMQRGISFLLKEKGVKVYRGHGKIKNKNTILISNGSEEKEIKGKNIVICTGSLPKDLPHIKFDGKYFVSSDQMLNIEKIPENVGIIGAGAVGVEFATIYKSFGSNVTIIEMLPHLLPLEDEEISMEIERIFKRRRIKFYTNSRVISGKKEGEKIILEIEMENGSVVSEEFERVLIATGRKPATENIGIDELGIETERGFIKVDDNYMTSVDGIFAIGDVINTPQLAHVASFEGIYVADFISNKKPEPINYKSIPSAVFSIPPVASVGFREKELKESGENYETFKFPFMANGKAKIEGKNEGFVKVISKKGSGKILGMHIVGGEGPEHIFLGVMGVNGKISLSDISRTIFPHPTISESLMEVAHIFDGGGIHI